MTSLNVSNGDNVNSGNMEYMSQPNRWIIVCFIVLYFICNFVHGQSKEGAVRIRRGNSDGSGYVEIYHNSLWGRVCSTGWKHENAHVVCKQLGYNGAQFPNPSTPTQAANAALPVFLNSLSCKGSEKQLTQCTNGNVWIQGASFCQTASVTCTPYLAQHLGCYNDDFARVLPNYQNCEREQRCNCDFTKTACISPQMTVNFCKDICCNGQVKYAFYGVEAGEQCFCGAATANYAKNGKTDNVNCHTQCSGNRAESCGADFKINVYGCNLGCEVPGVPTANLIASPQLQVKLYGVGDKITFSCVPGYTINGAVQIVCQTGGGWSHAIPTCQRILATTKAPAPTCSRPFGASLLYTPIKSAYNQGESITFGCLTGFRLVGSSVLTCQSTGAWSGAFPTCPQATQATTCSAPFGFSLSYTPTKPSYQNGETVTFTCAAGYQVVGSQRVTCQTTGAWSAPLPTCQRVVQGVTCSKTQLEAILPSSSSYKPIKTTYASGEAVPITCDKLGYILEGPSTITCGNTGQWSITTPGILKCTAILCDPLKRYANTNPFPADVVTKKVPFATSVSFTCQKGYLMTTSVTPYRTCYTNGWVGPEPVCTEKNECSSAPCKNGAVCVNQVDKYVCNCLAGFRGINCETIIDCGKLPTYTNAFPNTQLTVYGTTVTFSCHPGFAMDIRVSKQCTSTATWVGPNPVCKPTVCAPLPQYPLASPSTTGTSVGTIVFFTCQSGALLAGSSPTKTCQATGQWIGNSPVCTDINECASLPCKNGAACVNLLNRFVCNCPPGFSGANCATVGGGTANGNGTPCGAIPSYPNADPAGTSTAVASTITYKCKVGYVHTGNPPFKQCLPTGIWDGASPNCLPVNCGQPVVPSYLSIGTAKDFTFGKTVTYTCTDKTKTPSPYSTITCESTKLWSKPPPSTCIIKVATSKPVTGDPKNPIPGQTTKSTATVGVGGIDGNEPTSSNSGSIPISIWIVILMALIAIGIFILGFILVRRQHEEVRRKFGYPDKHSRKPRSAIPDENANVEEVIASAPPIIPTIIEPNDKHHKSLPDSDEELDLRPQTLAAVAYTETTPDDEYTYENEIEPEYSSYSAEYSQSETETSMTSDSNSESSNGGSGSQVEGAIVATAATGTETAPPDGNADIPGTSGGQGESEDKQVAVKGGEEGAFIDGLIDNAKGKVDDCVIS